MIQQPDPLDLQIEQTPLSTKGQMRLQDLLNAKGKIADDIDAGNLHPDEGAQLVAMVHARLQPLQQRKATTTQMKIQQLKKQAMDQSAQQQAIAQIHRSSDAQATQQSFGVVKDLQGRPHQGFWDAKGHFHAAEWDQNAHDLQKLKLEHQQQLNELMLAKRDAQPEHKEFDAAHAMKQAEAHIMGMHPELDIDSEHKDPDTGKTTIGNPDDKKTFKRLLAEDYQKRFAEHAIRNSPKVPQPGQQQPGQQPGYAPFDFDQRKIGFAHMSADENGDLQPTDADQQRVDSMTDQMEQAYHASMQSAGMAPQPFVGAARRRYLQQNPPTPPKGIFDPTQQPGVPVGGASRGAQPGAVFDVTPPGAGPAPQPQPVLPKAPPPPPHISQMLKAQGMSPEDYRKRFDTIGDEVSQKIDSGKLPGDQRMIALQKANEDHSLGTFEDLQRNEKFRQARLRVQDQGDDDAKAAIITVQDAANAYPNINMMPADQQKKVTDAWKIAQPHLDAIGDNAYVPKTKKAMPPAPEKPKPDPVDEFLGRHFGPTPGEDYPTP